MLDEILKYLSIITVAGAAISFVVGLFKYLDQRNREERTTRFKMFHDLMGPIVARGERANEGLALSQQVAGRLLVTAFQRLFLRLGSNFA
jgi:hypothetical protein